MFAILLKLSYAKSLLTKHLGQEAGQAHDTSFLVNFKMLLAGKMKCKLANFDRSCFDLQKFFLTMLL